MDRSEGCELDGSSQWRGGIEAFTPLRETGMFERGWSVG